MNTQFHKGVIEMCVLAMVGRKDCYGYELVEAISKRIEISEGTIYPILRRLTVEGFFETYLQESNEGPPRKYYRMKNKGREHTKDLVDRWNHFKQDVDELL